MKNSKFLMSVCLLAAGSVGAMTMSELQSAVDEADDGGTVLVTSDIEFAQPLVINSAKSITIKSDANGPWTLTRAASFNSGVLLLTLNNGAAVAIADLVVDGNKTAGKVSNRLVEITNGSLTLDAGAELKDFWSSLHSAVSLNPASGAEAKLTMNDGAVVRGFENDDYGVFVTVGNGQGRQAVFTMNGGLITGCKGHKNADRDDSDGVIYLYGPDWNEYGNFSLGTLEANPRFYFRGGTITGNTSDRCIAGIMAHAGSVWLSGNATCTNNVGKIGNNYFVRYATPASKLYCQCPMVLENHYKGRITFQWKSSLNSELEPRNEFDFQGLLTGTVAATPGANNVQCENYPAFTLDTYKISKGGWYAKWVTARVKVLGRYSMPSARYANSEGWPLWAALDVAQNGDVVQVCTDLVPCADNAVNGKEVTVESEPGKYVTLDRGTSDYEYFNVYNGGKLHLRNIRVTNTKTSIENKAFVKVQANSSLYLETGAELKGDENQERSLGVLLTGAAAYAKMENGTLLTGFRNYYGAAVRIGENADVTPLPTFEMAGGVISNCVILSSARSNGNGGAVYLNRGIFNMKGGLITENKALGSGDNQCAAGVVAYKGDSVATFSGDAKVIGNVSDVPDFYCYDKGSGLFAGDFRGCVGYSGTYPQATIYYNEKPPVKLAAGATGAWNLVATGVLPTTPDLVGTADGTDIVLKPAVGSVDGVKAAVLSDFSYLLPMDIDLSEGSADLQKLPHMLVGEARNVTGTVALSYDPETIHSRFPLVLFESGDDVALGRNLTFTYPAGSERMRVRRQASGHQLALDERLGAVVIVR